MSIGKKKGKKGSLGTSFIIEKVPGQKRISCSNCINYNSDNSCSAQPVFISEIGYNYWMHCESFSLDDRYDTEENRATVSRNRKLKKIKRRKIKIHLLHQLTYPYILLKKVVKHIIMLNKVGQKKRN